LVRRLESWCVTVRSACCLASPMIGERGCCAKRTILDVNRAIGIRDLADTITVRHITGGISRVKFKT
jgi:hypothetical protein